MKGTAGEEVPGWRCCSCCGYYCTLLQAWKAWVSHLGACVGSMQPTRLHALHLPACLSACPPLRLQWT